MLISHKVYAELSYRKRELPLFRFGCAPRKAAHFEA